MSRKVSTILKTQVTWRVPTVVVNYLSSLASNKAVKETRRVKEPEILTELIASISPETKAKLIEQGYEPSSN